MSGMSVVGPAHEETFDQNEHLSHVNSSPQNSGRQSVRFVTESVRLEIFFEKIGKCDFEISAEKFWSFVSALWEIFAISINKCD